MQEFFSGNQFNKLLRKKNGSLQEKYKIEKIDLQIIKYIRKGIDFNTINDLVSIGLFDDEEIAKSLERLYKQGLLEFVRDETNSRMLGFKLTRVGAELWDRLNDNYKYATEVLFRGMTEEQVETFKRLTQIVAQNIDREIKTEHN